MASYPYNQLNDRESLVPSIKLAFSLPNANEKMKDAFEKALTETEKQQKTPMRGNLARSFC